MVKKKVIALFAACSLAFTSGGVASSFYTMPIEVHAEDQAEDVTSKVAVLSNPTEIETAISKDNGFISKVETGKEGVVKFTVSERGWIIVKNYETDDRRLSYVVRLYTNASLSNNIGIIRCGEKGYLTCYVEAGTYYIKSEEEYGKNNQNIFALFIPTSSMLKATVDGKKITAQPSSDATMKVVNDKYAVDKISDNSWKDANIAKTMENNTYAASESGNYTVKAEFTQDVWKDYPVMVDVNVTGVSSSSDDKTTSTDTKTDTTNTTPTDTKTDTTTTGSTTNTSDSDIIDNSEDADVTDIQISTEDLSMTIGDEKTIKFKTSPEDTEADDLEWSSSDEDVAEVDDFGTVTAVSSGKAKITVQTEDGEVSASLNVVVKPEGLEFKSVKTTKKKIVLKWERINGVGGYQITYSKNQNFKGAKNKNVKAKATTTTISNLKSKKAYYVRVRSYQTISGKKYYSDWSKINKITVK